MHEFTLEYILYTESEINQPLRIHVQRHIDCNSLKASQMQEGCCELIWCGRNSTIKGYLVWHVA
jgi:hypothetical protein